MDFPNSMKVNLFNEVKWARRICLSLDGIVCEYDSPKMVKNFFGIDIPSEELFGYDLADVLGVTPTLINTMWEKQIYDKPNFIRGAIETLKEWGFQKYELVIYSKRIEYMGYDGFTLWLRDCRIPFNRINNGRGQCDIQIDDSPSRLMEADSKFKLLFDQPWNGKCLNITGKLKRVYTWGGIRNVCSFLGT